MTEQKAIETLEYIRYCNDYKGCAESIALDMAIKALKLKQNVTNTVGENIEDAYITIMRKDGVYEINGIDVYEAMEKQIPKKPRQSGVTDSKGVFHPTIGISGVPYDLCPNCKINLCTDGFLGSNKKSMKYCENCGQKLLWE